MEKLTQAYLFGNPEWGITMDPIMDLVCWQKTLHHNFGLQVDHYLAIDMQTFENLSIPWGAWI